MIVDFIVEDWFFACIIQDTRACLRYMFVHISNKVSGLIRFICNNSKRLFFDDMATIRLQVYNCGVESFTDG